MKKSDFMKEFIVITFATLIVSAAVFFFLIPSQVSVGSISGLAMILGNIIPLHISIITFILNGSFADNWLSPDRKGIWRQKRFTPLFCFHYF